MIVLITVGTMTLTPFISRTTIARTLMGMHPRYRRGEGNSKSLRNHAVLLGYGRAGRQTLNTLKEHDIDFIVIDDDASVINKLIQQGITCIQGDGSDKNILSQANAYEAKVILCSMRRSQDALSALKLLSHSKARVLVRTFEPKDAVLVRDAGGCPVEPAEKLKDFHCRFYIKDR